MKTAEPIVHRIPEAFTLTGAGGENPRASRKIMELAMQIEMRGVPRTQALELAVGEYTARLLEQADPAFQGLYAKAQGENPFARHVRYVKASGGFAVIGDLYPTGTMQKQGQKDAVQNDWQSVSNRIDTELWWWTGKIDYNTMRRLDSIFDSGFQRSLGMIAELPIHTEISQIVALLEANTEAHLGAASAFFSLTNPIPKTSRTFANTAVKPITTVAEVRTAIRTIQSGLLKQLGAMGLPVNGYRLGNLPVTLLAHPDKVELIEDAFEPGNMGEGGRVVLNDKAALPKWDRVYHPDVTSTKLYALIGGSYAPLVVAEEEAANFITTIGVPGNLLKILSNAELAQVRRSFKVGYGSPFAAFRITAS